MPVDASERHPAAEGVIALPGHDALERPREVAPSGTTIVGQVHFEDSRPIWLRRHYVLITHSRELRAKT